MISIQMLNSKTVFGSIQLQHKNFCHKCFYANKTPQFIFPSLTLYIPTLHTTTKKKFEKSEEKKENEKKNMGKYKKITKK